MLINKFPIPLFDQGRIQGGGGGGGGGGSKDPPPWPQVMNN